MGFYIVPVYRWNPSAAAVGLTEAQTNLENIEAKVEMRKKFLLTGISSYPMDNKFTSA